MSDQAAVLDDLVAEATTVLRQAEAQLHEVALEALTHYEKFQAQNGPEAGEGETVVRLQQLGQQLTKLSERSRALQNYLQNGLDGPPVDDDHWSRIRILQSQEEERTQLARELEDNVGQLLANAVFELASCRHLLGNDEQAMAEGLDALQQELEQGLADIRHFIIDLEPATILGNFGLGSGLRRYLEQFEARTGLKTELRVNTILGRLPSLVEIAIFRIIQEALQNVERHAQAARVEVLFEETEEGLNFSVIDDGEGLISDRVDTLKKNLGLARMVDYAELLSGKLRIFSDPGHGTQVVLSIPHQAL